MDLKYKSSQNLSVSEHPLQYKSFVQSRDVSFSSYLKPEENTPEDSEINVFDAKKYFSESNDSSPDTQKNLTDQCELASINRLSSVSSVDGYGKNFRANSFRATPTASSEASWNSQTGLLSNPPGAIPVSLRSINPNNRHVKRRGSSSTRKWFFCRKCPCSGKKSVQVEETNSEPRTDIGTENVSVKHNHKVLEKATNMSQKNSISKETSNRFGTIQTRSETHGVPSETSNKIGIQRRSETHVVPMRTTDKIGTIQRRSESDTHVTPSTIACQQRVLTSIRPFTETAGGFSFPILNQSTQAKLGIKLPPTRSINPILEDPARDSLEVFQPSSRKSTETDHRANFPFIPGSPISRVTATEDDVASDASSDLFEIESFSTSIANSTCPIYRSRNSLDEPATPSIAATECYAPSEVSIDWSVTTAEGYDRASITNYSINSEIDNVTNMRLFGGGSGGGSGGEAGKWKGSGLLSCRHEKAVNVGPQPMKFAASEGPLSLPLNSAAGHVSSRPARSNKPPIASTHSARLSLAFAA